MDSKRKRMVDLAVKQYTLTEEGQPSPEKESDLVHTVRQLNTVEFAEYVSRTTQPKEKEAS